MPPVSFPSSILAMFGTMEPFGFPIPFAFPLETEAVVIDLLLLLAISFLIGSIPWGVIVSRLFFKKDIRNEGSGNIGATNAMRSLGKLGGAVVFLLDFGKGMLCGLMGALLAYAMLRSGYSNGCVALGIAFVGCVLGHVFSPWLGFKGGKGIAVAIGCLFFALGIWPSVALLVVFVVLVALTRYVSVGSIVATSIEPLIAIYVYWGDWVGMLLMVVPAVVIVWAHRSNLSRLMRGEESRLGSKGKDVGGEG